MIKKQNGKSGKMNSIKKDFWSGKKVFVTGADGFIGSWVAKTLVEKKADVFVLVRDMKKESGIDLQKIRDKVTVIQGDLVDYQLINRVLNEYEVDSVFHLAAQALVGIANNSPISTFESNIRGTWSVLEACRLSKHVERIIVASSDKAYGVQKDLPYTEESPLLGLYPYDASKACTDILSRSYHKSFNLPVAVTRNANTYGGGDLNTSRIIVDAIRCALLDETLIIRSDGKAERDYMYVKDAVNGYLVLAENLGRKDITGHAFNFGTENPISVLDLIKKIKEISGKELNIKVLGTARNEIDKQYLNTSKAKRLLDWNSQYTIDKGLKETIDWYKEYYAKKY